MSEPGNNLKQKGVFYFYFKKKKRKMNISYKYKLSQPTFKNTLTPGDGRIFMLKLFHAFKELNKTWT